MDENNNTKAEQNINTPNQKEGVVGPIIGSTIIILLIVLGGLYFWSYLIENRKDLAETKTQENLETEIETLEQEIINEDADQIDSDLELIEKELDEATQIEDKEL